MIDERIAPRAPDGLLSDADAIWRTVEDRCWRAIEAATTLEALLADPSFAARPGTHIGFFSDHGVVHVRDVAARARALAIDGVGVLYPHRDPRRVALVAEVAHALAAIHDIGMSPANPHGRAVHAAYAAQWAMATASDDIVDALWQHQLPELRARIEQLHAAGRCAVPPGLVAREVLAAAMAHSKSAVPASVLADPPRLRVVLRAGVLVPLDRLASRAADLAAFTADTEPLTDAMRRYRAAGADPAHAAFAWLTDDHHDTATFAADVIDAVRVLRAADALRQRGTTLRTSAGFEVFADRRTGEAVFALRSRERDVLVLVRDGNPMGNAEANVRNAYLDERGVLRMSLHRERFDASHEDRIVEETAALVVDVAGDAIGSFPLRSHAHDVAVEITRGDATSVLVPRVVERVVALAPHLADRITVVDVVRPALRDRRPAPALDEPTAATAGHVPVGEDGGSPTVDAVGDEIDALFGALARAGMRAEGIDRARALQGVRRLRVRRGEVLMDAGTAAREVYVPLGEGLRVSSMGGYGDKPARAWVPVGLTGVVRGGERNGRIVAVDDVDVLVVPDDVYLEHWFRPFEVRELATAARRWSW